MVLDLLDFAGFDARSTDADAFRVAAIAYADTLDVRQPPAAGPLVREADLLAEPRLFAADFTPI
jgi:hypothetical protein